MEDARVCRASSRNTLLIFGALMFAIAFLCFKGREHATGRHPEAAMIRAEVARIVDGDRASESGNFKVCWTPLWGNLMIAFRQGVYECAAIYKVSLIHKGVVEPTVVDPRERTAFCKTGNYWDRIRVRDMYICIGPDCTLYDQLLDIVR